MLINIGLLTMGAIVLEVSFTRVFSVSQGYHFSFLVIGIALLGIGASGSFLMVMGERIPGPKKSLPVLSALFSITALLSYILINIIPFDIDRIAVDIRQPLFLLFAYGVLAIPFFFSGLAVALTISRHPADTGRIYFSDLFGAGTGGVLVLLFLSISGGMTGIIAASIMGAIASVILSERKCFFVIWAVFLLLLFLFPPPFLGVRISPYKELSLALRYPDSRAETHYNAISRVDIVKSGAVRTAPGLSLKYMERLPPQLGITIDGEGLVAVTEGKANKPNEANGNSWRFLEYLPSSLPYFLKDNEDVLILQLGGGMEVAQALYFGAGEVVVIENNPLLIRIIRDDLGGFTGGLLSDERVVIKAVSPREFLADIENRYDLIVLSIPTTLGASGTGLGGIGENYDLTEEALTLYLDRLRPGGLLTATLYLIPPPREELRLLSTYASALRKMGYDPTLSTIAIRSWGTITYVFKKGEFSEVEIRLTREFSEALNFDTAYFPGISKSDINRHNVFIRPIYETYIQEILKDPGGSGFYEQYLFDISPVTDDRPFYYMFFRNDRVRETYLTLDKRWTILLKGGYLVWVVAIQGLLLSLVLIILPVLIKGRGIKIKYLFHLYPFLAMGISFIFLEISLIERFILFLGEPTFAVSVILSSLLVSAGIGSYSSGRIRGLNPRQLLMLSLITVFATILLYRFLLPVCLNLLISLPLCAKYPLSAIIVAPLGFIMGFPFPMAIRFIEGFIEGFTEGFVEGYFEVEKRDKLIPLAWCINATASVVGSSLSVILALGMGFSGVMVISALIYLSGIVFLSGTIMSRAGL